MEKNEGFDFFVGMGDMVITCRLEVQRFTFGSGPIHQHFPMLMLINSIKQKKEKTLKIFG